MEKLVGFPCCPFPLINSKDGEANHGAHLLALAAPRSSFLLLVVAITTAHATLLSSTTIRKRREDFKLNCTGWFNRHCFSTPRHLNPGCIWPLTTLLLYCFLSHGVFIVFVVVLWVPHLNQPLLFSPEHYTAQSHSKLRHEFYCDQAVSGSLLVLVLNTVVSKE